MDVLLLGATGAAGRKTAAELLRQPDVGTLWLCGRRETDVVGLANAFGGAPRVRTRVFDVLAARDHTDALGEVDVVVSCAGPFYETEEPSVRAAVDAGVSYVSLCDDHQAVVEVRDLNEASERSGITVVNGCGLSPGITNMLIAHGAQDLEVVDSIDIALARSSMEPHGEATTRHFLYELGHEAPVIKERRTEFERAGSAPKLVYFPEPVGWLETFRSSHPEVLTLPERFESLTSLQFRLGLAERVTMDTARAFGATRLASNDVARRAFLTLTKPLRPLIDRLPPRGPAWSAARVDLHGSRSGTRATVSFGTVDRLMNFASITLTLAALRLGRGEVLGAGVRSVEEAFEPKPFLRDLAKRGIGVARLEPRPI